MRLFGINSAPFFISIIICAFIFSTCIGIHLAFASSSSGTISSTNKLNKICHDETCSSYGIVNWAPTLTASTGVAAAVIVNDAGLSGHLWGDEIGWVNLSPAGAGVTVNPMNGTLSGYAYSSNGSWINFSPTSVGGNNVGVYLVDNGSGSDFRGWAYVSGLYGGWMKFDCSSTSTCIKTDWRNIPARNPNVVYIVNPGGAVPPVVPIKPKPKATSTPNPPVGPPIRPALGVQPNNPNNPNSPKNILSGTSTNPLLAKVPNLPLPKVGPNNPNTPVNPSNPLNPTNPLNLPNGSGQNSNDSLTGSDVNSGSNSGNSSGVVNLVDNNVPLDRTPANAPSNKDQKPKNVQGSMVSLPKRPSPNPADFVYERVFPNPQGAYSNSPDCVFCLTIRKDNADEKNGILKWNFIPKSLELNIPTSIFTHGENNQEFPNVDLTSTAVTLLGGWIVVRYMIIASVRRLLLGF